MSISILTIKTYFLLFIIYAIIGWSMEVTCKLIQYRRFINRGFLIGPYCPIYGYGALLITILLNKYINDPIALFIMAIVVCGTLEYLTSYFMEKIFKARWWDYSQKKFNLNGRVCLSTIIPFGLLGLFIMYISNPFLLNVINKIPSIWLNTLTYSLLIIFIADNIVSGIVVTYIKKAEKNIGSNNLADLDNTEEITKKVKEVLQRKSILHRRLVNAYPTLQAIKIKVKSKKQEIKKEIEETNKEIKNKIEKEVSKGTDKIIKKNNKN